MARDTQKQRPKRSGDEIGGESELSFEQALDRLQQVVAQLEDGHLTLTDSLQSYEQGIRLLQHCFGKLQEAERKIEMLTAIDRSGNAQTVPFDADEDVDLGSRAGRRSHVSNSTRARTASGLQSSGVTENDGDGDDDDTPDQRPTDSSDSVDDNARLF